MTPPAMTDTPLDRDGTAVVVGSSLAGIRAAETLRAEGFRGRLVVIGAEHHPPYDRPPLSKQYLARTWGLDKLWLRPQAKLAALELELLSGHRATGLSVEERTVELDGADHVHFDGLVIATGAVPLTFDGTAGIGGVHLLRTVDDADALGAALGDGARLVVIGGGFIGCEVAATARHLGASVTIVEPLPTLLARALGHQVGEVCETAHREHGVDVRVGLGAVALLLADGRRVPLEQVIPLLERTGAARAGSADAAGSSFQPPSEGTAAPSSTGAGTASSSIGAGTASSSAGVAPEPVAGASVGAEVSGAGPGLQAAVRAVELADGTTVAADVVLLGIGVAPVTGWLAGSGLAVDGGVVVGPTLHAAPGVVAAGDVARWPYGTEGRLVRVEHWTNASEQAVVAARSLLAGQAAAVAHDPVPYVWSDQYDLKIQVIGLPDADDDLHVVDGSVASGRFVALYSRQGTVTGAVGIGRPRQLMGVRPLVQRRATVAEAIAASAP